MLTEHSQSSAAHSSVGHFLSSTFDISGQVCYLEIFRHFIAALGFWSYGYVTVFDMDVLKLQT
jgi:hypothetical protein